MYTIQEAMVLLFPFSLMPMALMKEEDTHESSGNLWSLASKGSRA
jgi:hypothetical protein